MAKKHSAAGQTKRTANEKVRTHLWDYRRHKRSLYKMNTTEELDSFQI